jgi:TetR/AcrR family transcriptional regulator, mexJK operon transcriptional repressor
VRSVENIRRSRGRPRDLDKLRAILDAASALFLERGIAATTMESVAERACVSKMTVYGHFRDKPALLSAVFERNIKAIRLPDLAVGPDPASSLAQLAEFGERLAWFLTRPEIVKTAWVMAACADEKPRLAAAFYAAGPGAMLKKVAGFVKSLAERGVLSIDDPELAAELLIVSWLGLSQLRQNLGVAGPPSADAIARHVHYATDTMLRAWSSASPAAGKAGATQRRRRMPRDATTK